MTQLSTEIRDRVALVTIANPPEGYMDQGTLAELDELTRSLEADDGVGAIVFTGGVDGVFIRHYDVRILEKMGSDLRDRGIQFSDRRPVPERDIDQIFRRMETGAKPTIAAINGVCLGGGLEFALACDLRVAAAGDYGLGPIEINIGILPGAGGTVKLARLIGVAKALELCLLGRAVGPDEALALGLVNEVAAGDVVERSMALGRQLAAKPPKALAHIKRLIRSSAPAADDALLALERTLFLDLLVSDEAVSLMGAMNRGEFDVRTGPADEA